MRALFVWCCFLLTTSVLPAQLTRCLNITPQIRGLSAVSLKPMNALESARSMKRSPYQPGFSVSGLTFGGETRTVPGIGVSYVPQEKTADKLVVSGGLLWSFGGKNVMLDPRFARVRRPQASYSQNVLGTSTASVGLGYVGAEYRYYFLQGDIQPYVGLGARALGSLYGSRWGVGAVPHGIAGLNVQISSIFNGFAEVQHLPGIGLGVGGFDSFRGMTTVAFGFTFAPYFTR